MLKFLKDLFSTVETENVKKEELLFWFENKTAEIYARMEEILKSDYRQISSAVEELFNATSNLDNAQCEDEAIEQKVKSVVLGHKSNYVTQLRLFLQELQVPDSSYRFAHDFTVKLDANLARLADSSAKSYYASQHLFFNQVDAITKIIKSINQANENIKHLIKTNKIHELVKIRDKINNLLNMKEIKLKITMQVEAKRSERNKLLSNRNELMNQIIQIEKGGDYLEFVRVKEKENEINREFAKAQDNILQFLFPFERSLKKLKRVTVVNDKMIENYLDNPIDALIADKEFKILKIMENLERNINAGSVELKDQKERDKTLARIKDITREKIEYLSEKFKEVDGLKKQIIRRLESFAIMKQKNKMEEDLERINRELKLVDVELKDLIEKAEIDFNTLDIEIIKNIETHLKIKVKLESGDGQVSAS